MMREERCVDFHSVDVSLFQHLRVIIVDLNFNIILEIADMDVWSCHRVTRWTYGLPWRGAFTGFPVSLGILNLPRA